MTPVILSRQQLDQLWEIDRSEIIDTLYRLDNGQLRAYREYYDVRGWDPHDRQVYTPIHEACYDRGGIFFAFFDDEQMIAAAALDTLPRGMNGELRQLLFFYVGAGKRGQGWGRQRQQALHRAVQRACVAAREVAARRAVVGHEDGIAHEDVLADGIWQDLFTEKPEPLTREEKKAWIAQLHGVALGSDAFFPFPDGLLAAAEAGKDAFVQQMSEADYEEVRPSLL